MIGIGHFALRARKSVIVDGQDHSQLDSFGNRLPVATTRLQRADQRKTRAAAARPPPRALHAQLRSRRSGCLKFSTGVKRPSCRTKSRCAFNTSRRSRYAAGASSLSSLTSRSS